MTWLSVTRIVLLLVALLLLGLSIPAQAADEEGNPVLVDSSGGGGGEYGYVRVYTMAELGKVTAVLLVVAVVVSFIMVP